MVMTEMQEHDDGLAVFFTAARAAAPEPSGQFLTRLIAQGEAVQAERLSAALAPPRPAGRVARGGLFAALAAALGGWGAMGGMVTAAATGLWIGFAGSETMLQAVGLEATGTAQVTASSTAASAFLPEADILALATGQ